MGLPRRVIVAPEGDLYKEIQKYFHNDPKGCFTKAGKAKARSLQKEAGIKVDHWIEHNYSPLFDKYTWSVCVTPDYRDYKQQLPRFHVEFQLKMEHLND